MLAKLVPELYCSDFDRSLSFYTGVAGFAVRYARPEERFAYLVREGAELMIEQPKGSGRTWLAGDLEAPYGRGMNLQIEVGNVDALRARFDEADWPIFMPMEEKWYRADEALLGNRQFIAQDADGYLLRFFQDLGMKPAPALVAGRPTPRPGPCS
ncbi:MAG TPA: VOC family protein [Alphaproteobacteria bacterium]|nr:VOC family protein [Alphaproteobacteria bacterium]